MEADHESRWPDLPLDILGVVLGRLPAAACRPYPLWRSLSPPPLEHRAAATVPAQFPWIVLHDGTLFDLSSTVPVYQVRLPSDAFCYSAGDNMLFLLHDGGRCSVMNALSGDTTHLPELAAVLWKDNVLEDHVWKVAMSKSLPNHGPIIALLVGHQVILSSCRPAGETNSCLVAMVAASIDDIAFFHGRFYALCGYRLIAFELNNGRLDKPTPPGDKPGYIASITVVEGLKDDEQNRMHQMERYLVESSGKLLLVMLGFEHSTYNDDDDDEMNTIRKFSCEVSEADMRERRWKKVEGGLYGQALLVSYPCSKSMLAAADGAREDCIYFLHRLGYRSELGSGVYNMRTKAFAPLPHEFTPLLQELTPPAEIDYERRPLFKIKAKSVRFPAWFYPYNVVTPTTGGRTYEKGSRGGGEGQPVGAKSWRRTCATFFSFHPLNFVCTANWIRRWDP